jgi:hypothetical protein
MDPITQKVLDTVTEAGKEAVSLIVNKTTADNHPEYEKAVISGTAEAIKDLAKSDTPTAMRIYESIKIKREQRDFFNISKVLYKVATLVKIKPKDKIKDDNDFFWNTIEHAKSVSNEEMQDLIAKIIAGEYNNPETYSMSTLQILKSLDKKALEEYVKVLGVCFTTSGTIFESIYSTVDNLKLFDLNFNSLRELQGLGLITTSTARHESFTLEDTFANKKITITNKAKDQKVPIPNYWSLTQSGREIGQHLMITANPAYLKWLQETFGSCDIEIK